MKELVSICIPLYNQQDYVEDCLKSILDIDYPRLEIIISDDSSTDSSVDRVKQFETLLKEKAENFIFIVNEKNLGICKNVNNMWKKAKGDYVKFIAADDILFHDSITKFVKYCNANPQCDIVHSNMVIIDDNVKYPVTDLKQYDTFHSKEVGIQGKNLTSKILEGATIASPSAIYRSGTAKKFGYYREDLYHEDTPYFLKVSVNGEFGYMDEIIGAYRKHQGSASRLTSSGEDKERHRIYLKSRIAIYKEYNVNNLVVVRHQCEYMAMNQ